MNDVLVHLHFATAEFDYSFHGLNIEAGVTPGSKLIINFEQPRIYVQIVYDKSGKGQLKFILVLDIVRTHWDRDVTQLEDALGT